MWWLQEYTMGSIVRLRDTFSQRPWSPCAEVTAPWNWALHSLSPPRSPCLSTELMNKLWALQWPKECISNCVYNSGPPFKSCGCSDRFSPVHYRHGYDLRSVSSLISSECWRNIGRTWLLRKHMETSTLLEGVAKISIVSAEFKRNSLWDCVPG